MTENWSESVPDAEAIARLDTGVAHIARVYDYMLGGKDNFAADRANHGIGEAWLDAALQRDCSRRAPGCGNPDHIRTDIRMSRLVLSAEESIRS